MIPATVTSTPTPQHQHLSLTLLEPLLYSHTMGRLLLSYNNNQLRLHLAFSPPEFGAQVRQDVVMKPVGRAEGGSLPNGRGPVVASFLGYIILRTHDAWGFFSPSSPFLW